MSAEPSPGPPAAVEELDELLRRTLSSFHRTRWLLLAALITLLIAAVAVLGLVVSRQQAELRASCGWWRALSGLPVTASPPARQPSRLAVELVAGARVAYLGQSCPGALPPPSASLRQWAGVYRVTVR